MKYFITEAIAIARDVVAFTLITCACTIIAVAAAVAWGA